MINHVKVTSFEKNILPNIFYKNNDFTKTFVTKMQFKIRKQNLCKKNFLCELDSFIC